jgi:MbtH protein
MTAHSTFAVVVNDEEQYSVWPADLDLPAGWRVVGVTGSRDECVTYIDGVWADIRPLSLRKQNGPPPGDASPSNALPGGMRS